MSSPYKIFAVTTNIISGIALIILFYVFEKVISPFHRGFFCDDESIQRPYVEKQTVPTHVLVILVALMVLLTIIICDVYNYLRSNRLSNCDNITIKVFGKISIKQWIYRIVARILLTFTGFAMCMILTGIGKRMVGRLRPHFLAVCKPDYTKLNCSDGYIDFNVCTSTDEKRLKEARLSFPSGHASSSAFASLFFALYIQYVIQPRQFLLLKPFVQFCGICLGIACALTRISDYFHHWSDVLVGYILGAIFALYTIFVLMNVHNEEKIITDERRDILQNNSDDVENQQSSTSLVATSAQPNYSSINKGDKET